MAKTIRFILGLISVLMLGVFLHPAAAYAVCSSPAGETAEIVYNSDAKVFQYCNGTDWVRMSQEAGSGSGGCNLGAAGTFAEGELIYNRDYRTLSGCAGSDQKSFGGSNKGWIQVDASNQHSCGIKSDGTLWCWGSNGTSSIGMGMLGDGTYTRRSVPTSVSGGGTWKQVSVGPHHTCAIKSDDSLWCWGGNPNGKTGLNTATGHTPVPTAISGGGAWKQVSAGSNHSCAIKSDDSLWCWGSNANGKTGLNTSTGNALVPTAVSGGGSWVNVSAGGSHTCAIKSDNTLLCWGTNASGVTGLNTTAGNTLVPTAVSGGGVWKQTSAGGTHSCAIKSDDSLWCWGSNLNGRTGLNTAAGNTLVPTTISGGGTWGQVSAGESHSCALKMDDALFCWGANAEGRTGMGVILGDTLVATAISGGGTWKQVAAKGRHTCAVSKMNGLSCWGNSGYGQLGDGKDSYSEFMHIVQAESTWKDISLGAYYACGIKSNNKLYCWGYDNNGETGRNEKWTTYAYPIEVSGGGDWVAVSTSGRWHTCGLKSDGSAWCWGYNSSAQLGDNSTTERLVPTSVSGGHVWKQIGVGGNYSCALRDDNTIWCWGGNGGGQTGQNTTTGNTMVPTQISGGGAWKQLSVGDSHACAVKSDDTLWCWGGNGYGKTGLNTMAGNALIPTQVFGGGAWQQISAGLLNTCGLKIDGTAWCWGNNWYGQIGDGTFDDVAVPTAVSGGGTWNLIHTNDAMDFQWTQTCGLKPDNSLWCWGLDISEFPTAVVGGGDWKKISVRGENRCVISTKGELYCMGSNFNGELTINEYSSPYRVNRVETSCTNPLGDSGALIFNADENIMQYCNGAYWIRAGR